MRVCITEYIQETFVVEVEDGLVDDELEKAVEEARVQYDGAERYVEVTDTDWVILP